MKSPLKKQWGKVAATTTALAFCFNAPAFAADIPATDVSSNTLAIVLLSVIIGLLLAIGLLANVVTGAAQLFVERLKEQQKAASAAGKTIGLIACCLLTSALFAADTPAADAAKEVGSTNIGGLPNTLFYLLLAVIVTELIVLFSLLFQLRTFLAKEKQEIVKEVVVKEPAWTRIWSKMNSFKPEHEVVDAGHNYDGIRELDNSLPRWWLYGFYACIVFAFVYIYRFHISHTGLSGEQEFQTELAKAEVEKEAYLKTAASKVDEKTVTVLTDAASLGAGQKLFSTSCSPCHGTDAQGVVGPNLTDDYWLHKGSIKDVFKTIKYGVQEKGMKAWKDDFSPVQIAQLASYIKSLHGTKPAGAKEPQGELFKEDGQAASGTANDGEKKLVVN
jgi:cytochrome c oxidase cbb3-type subunit 3